MTSSKKKASSAISMRHHNSTGSLGGLLVGISIAIIYNVLIIMYLNNLEDVACKCVMDWRHKYIKYFCGAMIVMSVLNLILCFDKTTGIVKAMNMIIFIGGIVSAYALFTYIGELDSTKCTCAVQKQHGMHTFLYVWRWVIVLIFTLMVLTKLWFLVKH